MLAAYLWQSKPSIGLVGHLPSVEALDNLSFRITGAWSLLVMPTQMASDPLAQCITLTCSRQKPLLLFHEEDDML
jgi:hypothetical protein